MLRIIILIFIGILGYGFCIELSTITPSSTVPPINDKYNNKSPDIITKRNIQVQELSKSFEPSREYYRRPSSSSYSGGSSYDRNRDKDVIVGYNTVSNTIAVADRPPSNTYHNQQQQLSVTPVPTNNYGNDDEDSNKYSPKGGTFWNIENKNKKFQDRLSIGHPGSVGNYISSSSGGPYGHPIPVNFNGHYNGGQYQHSSNTGREHGHGYDLNHKGYDDYGEYGQSGYSSYGHGGYGGGHGGGGDELYNKIALAKKYLIPIAGIAVLGVAAALIANPLLLQLGTVSSPFGKKRRRRDLQNEQKNYHLNDGQKLAYKGYNKKDI